MAGTVASLEEVHVADPAGADVGFGRRWISFGLLLVVAAGTAGAASLAVSEQPPTAPASTASTSEPAPATFPSRVIDRVGPPNGSGGFSGPPYCTVSYPARQWPPPPNRVLESHLLRVSDLPVTMKASPLLYASNGPDFDQLAAGFPRQPIAGVDFATSPSTAISFVSEVLGQGASAAEAAAVYRFATEHLYGDCLGYWGGGAPTRITLTLRDRSIPLTVLEQRGQDSMESLATVIVLTHVGDYVLDLSVGNHDVYPSTAIASFPSLTQVRAVVEAAVARLRAETATG